MPTYDYRCDRCERTFEVRQRISAEPLTACDRCGGPIRRLLSAAPFILKGGGWYVTDYPSEGRKKGMEAEKKSSGDAAPTAAPATTADGLRIVNRLDVEERRSRERRGRGEAGEADEAEANPGALQLTAAPGPSPSRRRALPSRTNTSTRPELSISAPSARGGRSA